MKKQSKFTGLVLLFIFAIILTPIHSQTFDVAAESRRMTKVPNSPEAQAFEKYGNTEVNLYHGTPNIQIPLYVHKGRELDLPISLTYDASGIKVDQIASNVGLGWNLNVGGRVSRVVNGMPDDYINGTGGTFEYYYSFWDDAQTAGIDVANAIVNYSQFGTGEKPSFGTKDELIAYTYFAYHANRNKYDIQPDYFTFNALGHSETITFRVNDKALLSLDNPRTKLEFERAPNGFSGAQRPITKWLITVDNGTKFTFEALADSNESSGYKNAEITYTTDDGASTDSGSDAPSNYGTTKKYISSWMLTRIESANGKDVYEFEYTATGYKESVPSNNLQGVTNVLSKSDAPAGSQFPDINHQNMGHATTSHTVYQQMLSKIWHNTQLIVSVDPETNRKDIGSDAIDKIHIHAYDNVTEHKTYDFVYDYFKTDSNLTEASYTSFNVRLMLKDLKTYNNNDTNNLFLSQYSFEYIDPNEIGSLGTNGRDYYGYYNGANNGQFTHPAYTYLGTSFPGADRNVHFNKADNGLLNKITYPTGGHTVFNYEPNKVREIDGYNTTWTSIGTLTNNTPTPQTLNPNVCNGVNLNTGDALTPTVTVFEFEVNDNTINTITEDYKFEFSQSGDVSGYHTPKTLMLVKSDPNVTPFDWSDVYNSDCDLQLGIEVIWEEFKLLESTKTRFFNLEEGHYKLLLLNASPNLSRSIVISKADQNPVYEFVTKAGIRIESVKDYSEDGNLTLEKHYGYPYGGTIISNPNYAYTSTIQYYNETEFKEESMTMLHRVSSSGDLDRPHIGYGTIIETIKEIVPNGVTPTQNQKTVYKFNTTNANEYSTGIRTYYVRGKQTPNYYSNAFKLGKPSSAIIYKNEQTQISSKQSFYNDKYLSDDHLQGLYYTNDESRSLLYPVPYFNASAQKWHLDYVPATVYSTLAASAAVAWITGSGGAPTIGSGQNQGGYAIGPPSECSNWNQTTGPYANLLVQDDLCSPSVGRLLKQKTTALRRSGNLIKTVEVLDGVEKITEYDYYDGENNDAATTTIDWGNPLVLAPPPQGGLDPVNFLLKTVTTIDSDQNEIKQYYEYPDNYNSLYTGLKSKNMVSVPIKEEYLVNGELKFTKKTNYGSTSLPQSIATAKDDNMLETRLNFEVYNAEGDLIQISQPDGLKTVFIYGHGGRYIVAKLENTTRDTVAALPEFDTNCSVTNNLTPSQVTSLQSIPNTLVTIYTYDPMVGVTSITDPRGRTQTFEYDAFHRLKLAKDADDNIISKNDYNYKPQN